MITVVAVLYIAAAVINIGTAICVAVYWWKNLR